MLLVQPHYISICTNLGKNLSEEYNIVYNACKNSKNTRRVTPLCSYTPVFRHPYVPPYTPLCSYTPMFLHPYVPTTYVPTPLCSYNLCSYTPVFLHPYVPTPYVPTPLCSYTPMFLRPYVPTPLYSFPPIFRHFVLDQHWVSGTN